MSLFCPSYMCIWLAWGKLPSPLGDFNAHGALWDPDLRSPYSVVFINIQHSAYLGRVQPVNKWPVQVMSYTVHLAGETGALKFGITPYPGAVLIPISCESQIITQAQLYITCQMPATAFLCLTAAKYGVHMAYVLRSTPHVCCRSK